MKKYMVVYLIDGNPGATFFDFMYDAEKARQDIDCGLGGFAEVYERVTDQDGCRQYELVMA